MTLSLSKKNVHSAIAMTLTMISLISPADAQTEVFSTKIRGRTYTCNVDTNKNPYIDCFDTMPIICDPAELSWDFRKRGNCQIGIDKMFASMSTLWQNLRKECGEWPFILNGKSYTGVYKSKKCATATINLMANGVYIENGKRFAVTPSTTDSVSRNIWSNRIIYGLITCGRAAASTPPDILAPFGTPDKCLSSDPSTTLSKRTINFAIVTEGRSYTFADRSCTCNTDSQKNPFADCLNSMTKICNPNDPIWNKANCQTVVDSMFKLMSPHWQAVRRECGQWQWTDGFTGSYSSDACATANSNLIANALYTLKDGSTIKVFEGLTISMTLQLWSNPFLA